MVNETLENELLSLGITVRDNDGEPRSVMAILFELVWAYCMAIEHEDRVLAYYVRKLAIDIIKNDGLKLK